MKDAFMVAEYLLERDDLRDEYARLCEERDLPQDSILAAKTLSDLSLYALALLATKTDNEDVANSCATRILSEEREKRDYAERVREIFGHSLVTSKMALNHEQLSFHVLTRAMRASNKLPHKVVGDLGVIVPDYLERNLRGLNASIYDLLQNAFMDAHLTRHEDDDGVHYVIHEDRDHSVGLYGKDLIRFGIHGGKPYYEEYDKNISDHVDTIADGESEVKREANSYISRLRKEIAAALDRMT